MNTPAYMLLSIYSYYIHVLQIYYLAMYSIGSYISFCIKGALFYFLTEQYDGIDKHVKCVCSFNENTINIADGYENFGKDIPGC